MNFSVPIHGHFHGHIDDFPVNNHDQMYCMKSVDDAAAVQPCIDYVQWA